jgi:hypothetical protein
MKRGSRIGRFARLAVGLGIAAALAATPGAAHADDFQISVDGMDLLPTAGNTAEAFSGTNDIAIAIGADSTACAGSAAVACDDIPGQFDSAFADGAGSSALSGDGNYDFASASGDGSIAGAGYGNFDAATANGTDSGALTGGVIFNNTTLIPGNDDVAFAWGPHTIASADVIVDPSNPTSSSNDAALVFDPFGTVGSSAFAGGGDSDLAAIFGDGFNTDLAAVGGNFLVDILPTL